MANVNEILMDYTAGKETLEATNKALMEADAGFHLDPEKNAITADEMESTTLGEKPSDVNGYGLLDTGTGSMEKVHVTDGMVDNVDVGEMYALLIIGGKTYHVEGRALAE